MSEEANLAEPQLYYPNRYARIILMSAREIVGENGVAALLNMAGMPEFRHEYPAANMDKAFSFQIVGKLQQAFWDMYGPRGAQVFATRAGVQCFNDGLKQFSSVARAGQMVMQVGSMEMRIRAGLKFFAMFFNRVSDQISSVSEDDEHWYWNLERCPMCWGRQSDKPVCHLAVGVLQGALAWASQGRRFRVTPVKCIAMGDEQGVIKIEKTPLE